MDRKTIVMLVAVGGVLSGWLLSVAYAFTSLAPRTMVRPLLAWQDARAVAHGRMLYAAHCAGCHGAQGQGQTVRPVGVASSVPLAPPHDGTGHTWQHPDFALFELTRNGISAVMCLTLDEKAMPRFGNVLSDTEILDVLAYVKSTWPSVLRRQQDDVNAMYASRNAALRDLARR